jgi:hypothetical protein
MCFILYYPSVGQSVSGTTFSKEGFAEGITGAARPCRTNSAVLLEILNKTITISSNTRT